MKKTGWIVMMLLAALMLSACGEDKTEPQAEPAAEITEELAAEAPAEQTPMDLAEPTLQDDVELTPPELAKTFIDGDYALLVEALGEPVSANYETSCMGDGDDGILQYDGFTVYTYLDTDGTETVLDVE